jgi:hypothetical protein
MYSQIHMAFPNPSANCLGKGAELGLADLEIVTVVGLLCLQNRAVNGLIAGHPATKLFVLSLAWQATKMEPLGVPNMTICFAAALFWRLFWGE